MLQLFILVLISSSCITASSPSSSAFTILAARATARTKHSSISEEETAKLSPDTQSTLTKKSHQRQLSLSNPDSNAMTFKKECVSSERAQALASAAKKSPSPLSGTSSPVTGSLRNLLSQRSPSRLTNDSGMATPKDTDSSCATITPSPLFALSPEPTTPTDTTGAFNLLFKN